jgi:hypothetical protein
MSDATTPANPTDQIATVAATPAVVPDAQWYDWSYDEGDADEACFTLTSDDGLNKRTEVMAFGGAAKCLFDIIIERDSLAVYIERLEAERDALLAEHEAVGEGYGDETADVGCDCLSCRIIRAHDNAERVMHGER